MTDRRSNMPARRTSLVGRARDVERVDRLLRNGPSRLVTLAGAGGVGKTSLALEAGRKLLGDVPDGVWFVDLGHLESPNRLGLAASAALGLADRTCTPEELLGEFLESREAVLILDGCEHLASAVGEFVDGLLDRCPDLRILATSRVPLHVRGETILVVPALDVPEAALKRKSDPTSAREIGRLPAVQLFVERARAARADFELTPEVAGVVASICRRLDGLPLAIEFAAAEVAALTPAQIEARLAREEGLKVSRRRIGPTRQQTMEATLDWSHGLLSPEEQVLFRRLAVFAGGWTLEAAETVCAAPEGTQPVSAMLVTLVEHSLVVREVAGGETRFRFLRTVAEYAARRLASSGESAAVASAHARYFLAVARRREPGPLHASPGDLDRIAREHANCLAALRWALRSGNPLVAAAFAAALIEFWRIRGLLRIGISYMEQLLTQFGEEPMAHRAVILMGIADYCQVLGDLDTAEKRANDAVAICQALDDPVRLRAGYGILGNIAASRGDFDAARAWYARAGALLARDHEAVALAFWLANMGGFALAEGNDDEALQLLERSLESFDERGPVWYRGHVIVELGALARRRGDLVRAGKLLTESLDWFRRYGARPESVEALVELGRLALDRGDPLRAVTLFAAASGLRDSMGLPGSASPAWPSAEIERARDRLPSTAFAEAWAAGREVSLDEIGSMVSVQSAAGPVSAASGESAATATGSTASTSTSERAPVGSAITPRELQVAELVALGLTNAEIAERLGISTGTARIHLERILSKLGLTSRVQIATWIVRNRGEALVDSRRD